ncbi:hypothetical protein GF326_13205 [Candidatus Bathyarchaeota archaeon]|nr:hypothetical protein [Candidatus Bathyarchaeota archaeon]
MQPDSLTIMGICYHCGKEIDPPLRCPHCNLTFCEEHLPQKTHKCIALSNNITGVNPQPLPKTIHYVEPEEEQRSTPRPRTVKTRKTSFLGKGITRRKVVIVALTLAISLGSIFILNQWQPELDKPPVGPVFPISKETIKHQEYVVLLINKERVKEDLPELTLDNNTIAQRYAEELLRTGVLKNNPDLPADMGENIMYFEGEDFNVTTVLDALLYDMVYDDADYDWGNRDNILYEEYTQVSVGVAYDENDLYLVQDFS